MLFIAENRATIPNHEGSKEENCVVIPNHESGKEGNFSTIVKHTRSIVGNGTAILVTAPKIIEEWLIILNNEDGKEENFSVILRNERPVLANDGNIFKLLCRNLKHVTVHANTKATKPGNERNILVLYVEILKGMFVIITAAQKQTNINKM